jgi:multicomponent Na+:H+ antiporter subunit C
MIAQLNWEYSLGHYNYWIVILLMMTGFYLVIARGNLIKTIIGLNIFQTSVVLLYVTMGKVKGGTAPIMPLDAGHGHDDHGHEDAPSHAAEHGHAFIDHPPTGSSTSSTATVGEGEVPSIVDASGQSALSGPESPTLPEGEYSTASNGEYSTALTGEYSTAIDSSVQLAGFEDAAHGHAETASHAAEAIIYSNPLPSVLMLTAIVVGVATTALALALTVRIREDYGTIEEDEILELDRAA